MLEKPAIPDETISACLRDTFGVPVAHVDFLPIGWVYNALFRVTSADGASYFLKLRRGAFDETAVAVPAFLHRHGIRRVMAPVATTSGALWLHAHGFDWILYPFFEGKSGFDATLSQSQWTVLGESMQAVHTTSVPASLAERLPREDYSPRWRNRVRAFHNQVDAGRHADPIAARLAAFWRAKRDEIELMVRRAEQLARVLQERELPAVICHSDLHAGNILIGRGGELAIVDWDEPLLAPKERDLMFIGGGVGGTWYSEQEVRWFYQGYGSAEIDLVALSYYRYERIVVDIAEYAARIFAIAGSVEERAQGLELVNQFGPNNVVEIAHRTYQQLAATAASARGGARRRSLVASRWARRKE